MIEICMSFEGEKNMGKYFVNEARKINDYIVWTKTASRSN